MHLNNRGWGTKEMIVMTLFLLLLLGISWYYIKTLYDGALARNTVTISSEYYDNVKSSLKKSAQKYYDDFDLSGTVVLSYDLLKKNNYISNLRDFIDGSCTGYVIVNNGVFKPYIKCDNYTSEGYLSDLE